MNHNDREKIFKNAQDVSAKALPVINSLINHIESVTGSDDIKRIEDALNAEYAGKTTHLKGTKVKIKKIVAQELGFEHAYLTKFKGTVTGTLTNVFPKVGTEPGTAIAGLIFDKEFKGLVVGNKINVFDGDFEVISL